MIGNRVSYPIMQQVFPKSTTLCKTAHYTAQGFGGNEVRDITLKNFVISPDKNNLIKAVT